MSSTMPYQEEEDNATAVSLYKIYAPFLYNDNNDAIIALAGRSAS